jgi:hypothetical protein
MSLVQLSQPRSRSELVLALVVGALTTAAVLAITLPVLSLAKALASSAGWAVFLAHMFLIGRSRRVHFDPDSRRIIVQWRNFVLAERRKEIPLSRFGSVLSYVPVGKSHDNRVCLVQHTRDRCVHIASYDVARKPRSFWDLVPPVVEAEGARKLRARLCSMLALRDGGFDPMGWPLKESK